MSDPIIFWNGNVFTLDYYGHKAEALLVTDGKIIKAGTNREIRRLFGDQWESVDLKEKTVLPGFIDSHVHFMATAIVAAGIDLSEAKSIDEILAKVEERARQTPRGEWVFGYFITHLPDRGMPTRFDLDRASTHHPIRLAHRNGHLCSMNTKALEILGVSEDPGSVDPGKIETISVEMTLVNGKIVFARS
jgi:predicted amidohydrolase YtcJ